MRLRVISSDVRKIERRDDIANMTGDARKWQRGEVLLENLRSPENVFWL